MLYFTQSKASIKKEFGNLDVSTYFSEKRIVNTNQGFICLTCNSATLVESHNPNNVTAWWSCDCRNCDYEFIESGHLYVCFPCQVDIKAGHVGHTDNVKCNKCGNDMILYNFQYLLPYTLLIFF